MMKKRIVSIIILCFVIFSCLPMALCADTPETSDKHYCYEYDNGVEIVFNGNTTFSEEQRQAIADYLAEYDEFSAASEADEPQRLSWCWLVGHKYKVDYVERITHKVRQYLPRCYAQIFEVTTCSGCDYFDAVETGSYFTDCCPED